MTISRQQTLFALDCGATNWRLYRMEYMGEGDHAQIMGEPQPASLTSFVDRRLPAVICLNAEGTALESYGEVAQQQLEAEKNRERVRDHFKPCIGSHLNKNPLPHQKRYTHAQALEYTRMLLQGVLDQLRIEKLRSSPFDERVQFSFAYPVHWRMDHDGVVFEEFEKMVRGCFDPSFKQVRFVAEPEGAILCLQRRGVLNTLQGDQVTLIVDMGGSTTDIVAGRVGSRNGRMDFIGRYGEPFGGGLYDAELAKYISNELNLPASAVADDPSALVTLRIFGQRMKESLSRQVLHGTQGGQTHQRTITLVMQDGTVYRGLISLDEAKFKEITGELDQGFKDLIENALRSINLQDEEIGQVVLVGGGSQLFSNIRFLKDRFGEGKVLLADTPEEIVVQGIGLEYGAFVEKIEPTIHFPGDSKIDAEENQIPPVSSVPHWIFTGADGSAIPCQDGTTKIGRGEENNIQVDDLKASRFHAELRLDGELADVVDLGSTNGTFVNGERLSPNEPHRLAAGDEIVFGKTKFTCNWKP